MLIFFLTAAFAQSPFDLVRVDDPDHPDAVASSATGAVIVGEPPAGVPWSYENVPHVEAWVADEAIEAMNIESWHDRDARGAGVKVAVFDLQWFGAVDPDELGIFTTHDCWTSEDCDTPIDVFNPRFAFEAGVHGYACAEIVHDIAPDAELHLVRVNGPTTFENAVGWAIRNDIDVISLSMSFFNDSFYDGTGPVADNVARLAQAGIVLVASAGNYGQKHWKGSWLDANGDGHLDFDGDGRLKIWLDPSTSGRSIYLSWNQHRSCGKTDIDAVLYDPQGRIAYRADRQQRSTADQCAPVERIRVEVETAGFYELEVTLMRGVTADLEVSVMSPGGNVDGAVGGGIPDPGASPLALTVGAVSALDYLSAPVERFSSVGPTYGGYAKPDLVGPDRLSTSAFGSGAFSGTSAATPAVAGALAVVMSEEPGRDATTAADLLRAWAIGADRPFEQRDPAFGWGRVRLPLEPERQECGRRPLVAALFLPLLLWRRRQ